MQCCGITAKRKRCRNTAGFLFCHQHVWQPATAVIAVVSLIGFLAGFFQDAIKPLAEKLATDEELRKPVAVEVKANRRSIAQWEQNPNPLASKSD